jgi:hypothetical protein
MARRKKADKGSVKVNFKGIESRQTPPEGDYAVKVLELVTGQSANKNDQIEGTFEISRGQYKGVKLYMYFPLQENSLWKLHAFLTALGEEVPEDEMDIDLSDLVDKEFVGVVTHETYNGRKRAKLTDFDSIDNYEGGDDEKAGKGKKGGKGKSKDEPEKVSRSDVEDMDEDELQELLEKHDLEDEVDLDDHKKLPKKVAAVIEALEEADLLEDDEPEEKPAKGKKGKKSKDEDDEPEEKSSKKSKKGKSKKDEPEQVDKSDVMEMDEEELQELLEKHDLEDEVDLDDYKKIGKKREAVCEALDDEDLLNDDD